MTATTHFTAWLVNDASALDTDFMDVTILEDQLIGGDPEDDRSWSCDSSKPTAFQAVTEVNAKDGDVKDAISQAEDLMAEAGWSTVGNWEAVDNAYVVTVEQA